MLEGYYKCRKLCDRCDAIQNFSARPHPMTYKNTARDAPYVATFKNHDIYLRQAKRISPWSKVPGWSFDTLPYDMMHLVFLGIAKNHVPSCLKILKLWGYYYEEGESDDMFLKKVSYEMKQDCKRKRCLDVVLGIQNVILSLEIYTLSIPM